MNKLIQAIKTLDIAVVEELLDKEPKWLVWSEKTGKNALHYLCRMNLTQEPQKSEIQSYVNS